MSIKQTRIVMAILAFITVLAFAPAANASPFVFTGSGTWDQGTPTTAYSEAGATWQFSFALPDTLASNPTTQATGFSYSLNGAAVATSLPGGVLFYSVANGGGFDLYPTIDNTSGINVISLLFPSDVGSNLSLVPGVFQASIALNDGVAAGSGSGTVTISAVPEPSSIILLGTALLLGSWIIWDRRTEYLSCTGSDRNFEQSVVG